MTKLIVSVAALQLVERGLISLDTPISQIIPEFSTAVVLNYPYKVEKPAFQPAQREVTVMNLLNHTSGLYYILQLPDPPYALQEGYTGAHLKENPLGGFIRLIKGDFPGIPLKFEPGTNWVYGWNSDILGFLVAALTGISLEQYCQDKIFKPLGMKGSFYLTPELKKNLVRLTFRNPDGAIVPWAGQTPLIEQDPSKNSLPLPCPLTITSDMIIRNTSVHPPWRDRMLLIATRLPISPPPYSQTGISVDNQIMNHQTAESLFQPTLTPKASKSLERLAGLSTPQFTNLQFSTGLALATEDAPGLRRKGTGWWAGWAGTSFFIDTLSSIAVVFGTQMVPTSPEVSSLFEELERTLYANLKYWEPSHKL